MKRALLLNADWQPLHFVSEEDAIYLLYLKKAEMIVMTDGSPSAWAEGHGLPNGDVFPAGATLRLLSRINKRWKKPKFRKRVLFNRDNWRCQYCNHKVTKETAQIEHIYPESRGGKKTWINCVTACARCNSEKRDRTPEEAGMKLLSKPCQPNAIHFWDVQVNSSNLRQTCDWHQDWEHFLPK